MIEFKVVASVDKSQQAIYQHWGNELTVGCLVGDMILDDPQISEQQFRVSIHGEKAILENLFPDVEIRVNGKVISGPTELKIRDNLNVGKTSLNFTRLDSKQMDPPEPFIHPQALNRFTEGSKEMAVLEALTILEKGPASPDAPAIPPLPTVKPPIPPLPRKP